MALTESERYKLYYEKNKERIIAHKVAYQKENKDKIAQKRKERRTVTFKKQPVLTVEQNIAQTRSWWGQP
jgi:hypothetical protein